MDSYPNIHKVMADQGFDINTWRARNEALDPKLDCELIIRHEDPLFIQELEASIQWAKDFQPLEVVGHPDQTSIAIKLDEKFISDNFRTIYLHTINTYFAKKFGAEQIR